MTEREPPPDIVLIAVEWLPRAMIRAQLIEQGYSVVAVDTWASARPHLRPGQKPRLVIVDLEGLPAPETMLRDLRVLMPPQRVLVVTALGTMSAGDVKASGFGIVSRPIAIEGIVREAAAAMHERADGRGAGDERR